MLSNRITNSIVVSLLLISLFTGLGILELDTEEPGRASVSMEMILSDQYIGSTLHGWYYYDKSPLFDWVLVVFFKLFNSFDEWDVRLPFNIVHELDL